MTPLAADAARLQDILGSFYAGRTLRDEARSSVIDVVLDRLQCSRVSLWKFAGDNGRLSLLCFASKNAGGVLNTSEQRLDQDEYRDYFNALVERGTFHSDDAMSDPALQPMRASYLVPHNVLSVLDSAFLLNGRAYGMVCCEETAKRRAWRAADVSALRAIVTRLAVLMSGAPESLLWATPSLAMRTLSETVQPAPSTENRI